MGVFTETSANSESYWRSIILFGRNVASYKFALASSLLELASKEAEFVRMEDLAVPFATRIAEHLKISDKQSTSGGSRFLDYCRQYNRGEISFNTLVDRTVELGFNNVIDAFHVVNQGEVPVRFYLDERKGGPVKGIRVTDELLKLKESFQFQNFGYENEARWRLVEKAWELGISRQLLQVHYEAEDENLFVEVSGNAKKRRVGITSGRDALNGYQKGKCFYCFADITVNPFAVDLADVDHFFPHTLFDAGVTFNLNGIWNLVLACQVCNRGNFGKFTRVPKLKYLERLHKRNNFLVESHHPLRETIMQQTGYTEKERQEFLQAMDGMAIGTLIHRWEPVNEREAAF